VLPDELKEGLVALCDFVQHPLIRFRAVQRLVTDIFMGRCKHRSDPVGITLIDRFCQLADAGCGVKPITLLQQADAVAHCRCLRIITAL